MLRVHLQEIDPAAGNELAHELVFVDDSGDRVPSSSPP